VIGRLLKLLNERETHIFLFVLGCILANWPFLQIFLGKELFKGLMSVFVLWIILVFVLFSMSRGCGATPHADNEQKQKERS